MRVVVGAEGHAVAAVRVEAAPAAFQEPGAEEVLPQFRHIVAVALLPAVGKPVLSVDFHVENITTAAASRKGGVWACGLTHACLTRPKSHLDFLPLLEWVFRKTHPDQILRSFENFTK